MKTPPYSPNALATLLERFGVDASSFHALRPDSYEQVLRQQPDGLELLEQFYSVLFAGGTQEDQSKECPPWPKGSKWAGRQPSPKILSEVWARIGKDQLLAKVDPIGEALEKFSKRLMATPLGKNEIVLQAVTGILGEQLMADAIAQRPANLKMVAAIQNQGILAQNEKKLKQKEGELALAEKTFQLKFAQGFLKWFADKKAQDIASSTSDNSEKINKLGELMFGKDWKE